MARVYGRGVGEGVRWPPAGFTSAFAQWHPPPAASLPRRLGLLPPACVHAAAPSRNRKKHPIIIRDRSRTKRTATSGMEAGFFVSRCFGTLNSVVTCCTAALLRLIELKGHIITLRHAFRTQMCWNSSRFAAFNRPCLERGVIYVVLCFFVDVHNMLYM